MVEMDIDKLSKRLGIKRTLKDDPLYKTAPQIIFTSQSGRSTTDTSKDSASQKRRTRPSGYARVELDGVIN